MPLLHLRFGDTWIGKPVQDVGYGAKCNHSRFNAAAASVFETCRDENGMSMSEPGRKVIIPGKMRRWVGKSLNIQYIHSSVRILA